MKCRFITVEGIDGAGKSTQLTWLAEFLTGRGVDLLVTREPGGTPFGERLREIALHGAAAVHPETEALLMFAARREHLARVIEPALAAGRVVLCDRFTDATFAYQGGGHGVGREKLEQLERWVHPALQPDLTLYFDLPVEVAKARLQTARAPDRFERQAQEFFERVRGEYLRRAALYPDRIIKFDAGQPAVDIRKLVEKCVADSCL